MRAFLRVVLAVFYAVSAANAQSYSPDELRQRTMERRAVEAVNWGIPAVNFDRMAQAMIRDAKGNLVSFGSKRS